MILSLFIFSSMMMVINIKLNTQQIADIMEHSDCIRPWLLHSIEVNSNVLIWVTNTNKSYVLFSVCVYKSQ